MLLNFIAQIKQGATPSPTRLVSIIMAVNSDATRLSVIGQMAANEKEHQATDELNRAKQLTSMAYTRWIFHNLALHRILVSSPKAIAARVPGY